MKIQKNNEEYTLLSNYHRECKLRSSFNKLAKKVFDLSFEPWYQLGYWHDKYIPYTLFENNIAVANASVNLMNFEFQGLIKNYIQIGTVMTDDSHRGMGLCSILMEYILNEWKNKVQQIYLFANKTTTTMYPKFGFKSVIEHNHLKLTPKTSTKIQYEKLNMDDSKQREMLYNYAKNSIVLSKLAMRYNPDMVMFYCTSFLKNNIFYLRDINAIVIVEYDNNQTKIWDIFTPSMVNLDGILATFNKSTNGEIALGFTPIDTSNCIIQESNTDESLFILNDNEDLFSENQLMFPLLSHA